MTNEKIEINAEVVSKLLAEVKEKLLEERTLALDRFKKQDDSIDSSEQFMFQGKILAEYLRAAADRTDKLFDMVKLAAGIVYKNENATGQTSNLSDDDIKREIQRQIQEGSSENTSD